jgi:SAM-dependent methyltransferase
MRKNVTKETYEKSAKELALKFKKFTDMNKEVSLAFSYINLKNPCVLEIGCGTGRDAKEISKYTKNYLGLDYSKNMINFAKRLNPQLNFIVADIKKFNFPDKIDIIFASASLLHLNKTDFKVVMNNIYSKLKDNGIVYMNLKYGKYQRIVKKDEYGTRIFYYYTKKDIELIVKEKYIIVYYNKKILRNQEWFTIILKKKDK